MLLFKKYKLIKIIKINIFLKKLKKLYFLYKLILYNLYLKTYTFITNFIFYKYSCKILLKLNNTLFPLLYSFKEYFLNNEVIIFDPKGVI